MPDSPLFSFGPYTLGDDIANVADAVEFSEAEYRALQTVTPNEQIFKAPQVEFLGASWAVDLGCVDGKVYKIAPHWESADNTEAANMLRKVNAYCRKQWGRYAEKNGKLKLWRTWWGNAVLQRYDIGDSAGISLFFTAGDLLRSNLKPRPYRFGKWFGYFQIAAGIFAVLGLFGAGAWIFPLSIFGSLGSLPPEVWRVLSGVAAIVVGYGLVEKRKWALGILIGLYSMATIVAGSEMGAALRTTSAWNALYTDSSKSLLQKARQQWFIIASDPRYLALTSDKRQRVADVYFQRTVKDNPDIANALAESPGMEGPLRQVFFSEVIGSQQYSSGDLTECAVQQGLDRLDNCLTQYKTYYTIQLLFAAAFAGVIGAYYWKRKASFR